MYPESLYEITPTLPQIQTYNYAKLSQYHSPVQETKDMCVCKTMNKIKQYTCIKNKVNRKYMCVNIVT